MDDVALERGITPDGLSADEAFKKLGNETRLNILRALWSAAAPANGAAGTAPMSYTALRRTVGLDDSGQFNYHLSKLTPHFVRELDEGYRLTRAGERIARSVITVADAFADFGFPRELETDCPFCGSTTVATYEDQQLRVRCTECRGSFGDTAPSGTIAVLGFPTGGTTDRTPEDVLQANLYKCQLDLTYMMHGICRECGGPVRSSVTLCDDHEPADGPVCDACSSPFEVWVDQRCERCFFGKRLPVELYVTGLAPAIGFFYDHGVDVLEPSFEELSACLRDWYTTTVRTDPVRVTVAIESDGDGLALTLDEEMTVVDVERDATLAGVTP